MDIGVDPAAIGNLEQPELLFVAAIAPARRRLVFQIDLTVGIIVLEDQVDHPPIGRKAEALGDFFGEHLDPRERFGRVIGEFAEGADADAVDQNHRLPAAAATARRSGARADLGDQIGDRGHTLGGNLGLAELQQRRLIDHQLALEPPGADNDLAVGGLRRGAVADLGATAGGLGLPLGLRHGDRLRLGHGALAGENRGGYSKTGSTGAGAQQRAGKRREVHHVPSVQRHSAGRPVAGPGSLRTCGACLMN